MAWVIPAVDEPAGTSKTIRAGLAGPVIEPSGNLRVRWADGTEEVLKVQGMYHGCPSMLIPAFSINYHGAEILAPVHLMNCRVWLD